MALKTFKRITDILPSAKVSREKMKDIFGYTDINIYA